jgi:hypothetical protein
MIAGGIIAAIILVIAVLTVIELAGQNDEDEADAFPSIQPAAAAHEGLASEPYFLGDPDAPVHLVEWSDYQ